MGFRIITLLVLMVSLTLAVSIGYADRDEFDSAELDPAWIWDNPASDSDYDLADMEGWLKLTCAAGDHDIWDVRSGGPALILEAPEDYTIETHYVTEIIANCSVGMVFLNEDAVGDESSPGPWAALFTQVGTRLDWQHAVGMDVANSNVANSNDAYVMVEKTGEEWKIFYKENEDDDWELVIEDSYDIGDKHYAGLMVKNWSGPEISAHYEYIETSWSFLSSAAEPAGKLTATWGQIKQR